MTERVTIKDINDDQPKSMPEGLKNYRLYSFTYTLEGEPCPILDQEIYLHVSTDLVELERVINSETA